ncbi:MAG: type II secretion system F family protein [Burkholderiaceae bacterium]
MLQSVQVLAGDPAGARDEAGRAGWQVLSCEPIAPRNNAASPRKRSGRPLDIATFAHELATLLDAGLSVLQALNTIAQGSNASIVGSRLSAVALAVSEGMALSAAMERQSGSFPALLVATIRASEQTGNLSRSLLRYAEHQQGLKALRDKVSSAAVYPLLLLVLGGLVVVFLLGVVVPKFATLIEGTHKELPWTSQILMSWGRLVAEHAGTTAASALALTIGVLAGVRHLFATGGRARWVEALPVIGPTIREFRHAQLYRTTGMLLAGGIPVSKALLLSVSLLGTEDRLQLERAVALIHEGRSLSHALESAGLADVASAGMLAVAERTGAMAAMLDRIAQFKEARLQRSVDWTSRLIEPALMIFIGLVIGAIVVLMYLPIFDLASSLQ